MKRAVVVGMVVALTGCGLIAGFGDKPELGDVNGADAGATSDGTTPTIDGAGPGVDGSTPGNEAGSDGGCPGTQTACSTGCTDTQTDRANCGTCGKTCGATFACTKGVCDDAVVALSAGAHHACAKLSGGAVYCWGNDDNGQVGNGEAGAPVTSPVLVPRDDAQGTFANPTQLSLGNEHSCALFAGGTMRCWGSDFYGQLSNGHFSSAFDDGGAVIFPLPHAASQSSGIQPSSPSFLYTSLGVGSNADHGCATTTADGGVVCWGRDDENQVGADGGAAIAQGCGQNGDVACYPLPDQILQLSNVTQLAVGAVHTCAVVADGSLLCWGINGDGEIGIGTHGLGAPHPPTLVQLDAGAAKVVAAGTDSTCAVVADGSVWCWGFNTSGELGHDGGVDAGDGNCCVDIGFCGFEACTGVPSKVANLGPASSVEVGCAHACALEKDGTVWCWGANDKGQLGTGDNTGSGAPRQVSGLTGAKGISLGCDTSCAWKSDGTAWCWGLNADSELGNANPTNASTPTQVILP